MNSTLAALPWMLAVVGGVGVPVALLLLPRADWRERAMVACLALAFGPALLTAWMFVLGTLGQNHDPDAGASLNPMQTTIINHTGGEALLTPALIGGGLLLMAIIAWVLTWRKARTSTPIKSSSIPLVADEKVLITLVVVATVARWVIQSWLPFGSWDPLWVYGFQGRAYTLAGYIAADIGYYPQFVPLQYAFTQIMTGSAIDDHAARAVMPLMQVGSILAVYVLGSRNFSRRVGILAAAIWALYPHFGYWTRVGDLEIPLTFAFTGTIAFFLMAWTADDTPLRRRYALIAGMFFGVAMWTKPTAGAFILGTVLVVTVEFLRVRGDWRAWWPRFEVALITGLACVPLGALWYARNLLIGHDALVFPPSYWQTQAMRSGQEFGWLLLALGVLVAYLYLGPLRARPNRLLIVIGVILIGLGITPTILEPAHMGLVEWVVLIAGVSVLTVTLARYAREHLPAEHTPTLHKLAWAGLIILPYFMVWFYSYSYHYRLSFAIVPVMILPTAVILAHWFTAEWMSSWRFPARLVYAGAVLAIAAPGVMIAVYDEGLGWDWLWTIPPPDDFSKAGLLGVVATLDEYVEATGQQPMVYAPGLQPLPFFYTEGEVRVVDTPRETEQLAGATHFINSHVAYLEYERDGDVAPFQNQWLASLPRANVTTRVATYQDPSFFYEVYKLHPESRFDPPEMEVVLDDEIVFGDVARLHGFTFSTQTFEPGGVIMQLAWQSIGPAELDYTIYVHLFRESDPNRQWAGYDGPVRYWDLNYYATRFWEADEYIMDRRHMFLQDPATPAADDYRIRLGFYDPVTGDRLPLTVNGEAAGDGYTLDLAFSVP